MSELLVFYASMSGNSEFLAGEIVRLLDEQGQAATLRHADTLDLDAIAAHERVIAVIPSWGDGELPADAEPLGEALAAREEPLTLRYALVAPGDRSYPDFCGGGRRFAELLDGAGATAVGERLELDGGPVERHVEAVAAWLRQLDWAA